jgi:hypothetical protein
MPVNQRELTTGAKYDQESVDWYVATVIAALITAGAMLLTDSDGGGTRNNCTTQAQCAGGDINGNGQ